MFYFQKMTEKCDNEPEVSCWWRTSGFKLVTLRQLQLKTTTSIKSTLRMFSAAADGPHWQSRSRLSHRPGDLLYLSTSSSFGIHPHNSHHLGRLLLSAFLSLLPPFHLFSSVTVITSICFLRRPALSLPLAHFPPLIPVASAGELFPTSSSSHFSSGPLRADKHGLQSLPRLPPIPHVPPHPRPPPSLSVRGTNAFVQYLQQTD